MTERRKRVRPTLGQVRLLEQKIGYQEEIIDYMDRQIRALKEEREELLSDVKSLECEIRYLNERSFWRRLFNK